jgi:hypothetical protein
VVIDDFHIVSIRIFPLEAYAPLLIDSDAVLPGTISAQRFEAVARQRHQVINGLCVVQYFEPSFCLSRTGFEFPDTLSMVKRFCIFAAEGFNHVSM